MKHHTEEVTNVYHPYRPDSFLGYVHNHRGKWIATPDETVIQRKVESKEAGIKFLESYHGCHL